MVGKKEIAQRKRCDACVSAEKEEVARLGRLQMQHETRFDQQGKELTLQALLERAGINAWEHGESKLDSFDHSEGTYEPVTDARSFLGAVAAAGPHDPVRGLYYWGNTGTGKTHLAVGVVRELLHVHYRPEIVFDHAAELIARIQDTYGRTDARTFDVLESRFNAGLWILDDLGTERYSDDVVRHLTLIFAKRAMRPTLVTSNMGPKQLQVKRPDLMRVLSRLGPRYFRVREVIGRDRRFD